MFKFFELQRFSELLFTYHYSRLLEYLFIKDLTLTQVSTLDHENTTLPLKEMIAVMLSINIS